MKSTSSTRPGDSSSTICVSARCAKAISVGRAIVGKLASSVRITRRLTGSVLEPVVAVAVEDRALCGVGPWAAPAEARAKAAIKTARMFIEQSSLALRQLRRSECFAAGSRSSAERTPSTPQKSQKASPFHAKNAAPSPGPSMNARPHVSPQAPWYRPRRCAGAMSATYVAATGA